MRQILLFIFSFVLLFIIHNSYFIIPVHAEGEFSTSYKVRYDVNDTGGTTVSQNITLKNNTTNFYADKFELKIGSTKVENVKAADTAGTMETETKFENNVTTISVKFNQKVIGNCCDVSIPRLAKSQDITDYSAT